MKSPIYYGLLLLVCGFVLPACIHVHPGQSAFAQDHDSAADERRGRGDGDDRVDPQVQRLVEHLERLHQEIGRVEEELEQLHQRRDRGEAGNRERRGRSERDRQQRNRANRGDENQDHDVRMVRRVNTDGDQSAAAPMRAQRAIEMGQRAIRQARGAAARMPDTDHYEMIVDLDRPAPGGRMMGIDVPGNSDHGVFVVSGAAQGGAEGMKYRRGARDRGQQQMDRRASMGRGGMAMRGTTMGRGSMAGRGQMMGRGARMDRTRMMGFVPSPDGHQGIAMRMNPGAGLICANCQGSTFFGGDRPEFGNAQKSCQNGCGEGDACPRCAGKDDGKGEHRVIKRVMRFDGEHDELDDDKLHLEHLGGFDFGDSGDARVIMIRAEDCDGELPDEIQHLLKGIGGVGGSTADIEVHHFSGDDDGGQIGDRVFKWEMKRPEGNREVREGEHSSEMQFDIQINSDGDMPVDIQRILRQVGGNHEANGEIQIHTIIEQDGNQDEKVIEWNGDLDEIPAAIQEIIDDLEGGAIQFGGGEGHGGTILIEKIAEEDGQNKKAKAGNKKAAAKKNKKNNKKNNKNKKTKKPAKKNLDEKNRDKANQYQLKNKVLTLNGRVVL